MKDPYLLHIFNPTKNVSPFDVNMAYEAEFDGVIPYTEVSLEDVHTLTQDTIFSRGPTGVKRTGIFIGGREFGLAMDMLQRAKVAMVPPFEVSVFADPSGAITTAAALVACIEVWVKKKAGCKDLKGKNIHILGGTGPVGVCAGILAANCGANVFLASHRGKKVGDEVAAEYNRRFNVNMQGADFGSEGAILELLETSHVMVGSAKAGVQVLSKTMLKQAREMIVAADVNAVPPLGIEGVGVNDMGVELDFTPKKAVGIGALAIGNVKYKVHYKMFEMMKTTDTPLYLDHVQAFEAARKYAAK